MKKLFLITGILFSVHLSAAKLQCGHYTLPLVTEDIADEIGGSSGVILYTLDNNYYTPLYITELDGLPLLMMTYCGRFNCPSDVYKKGGRRTSNNMVFEFGNSYSRRTILTINKSSNDLIAPKSFKAKLTSKTDGQYGKIKKVRCTVHY